MAEKNAEPTNKARIGTVCVSEWTNKKDDNEFKTYSIQATYFDKKSEEYKEAKSLSANQLHNLKVCIDNILNNLVTHK